MILSERKIPKELLYFRALEKRLDLSLAQKKKLSTLEKGYIGELLYDSIYDEVLSHLYVFRDIYLKIDDSTLQCDTLIVSDAGFIVNEIKNYQGIYTYENEKWYVRKNEISENPIIQMKRTTSKLIQLKYLYNENFETDGKVIFPNSEFALDTKHPTAWDYIVMRQELRRYFYSLCDLEVGKRTVDLSKIIQEHIVDNPYFKQSTNFSKLKKGLYCRSCSSFDLKKIKFHFRCEQCGHKDTVHTLMIQALADYNILFNDGYISRKKLSEFLAGAVGHSTLSKYLNKYSRRIDNGRTTKYKFNYYDFDDALKNEHRLWRYYDMPLPDKVNTIVRM